MSVERPSGAPVVEPTLKDFGLSLHTPTRYATWSKWSHRLVLLAIASGTGIGYLLGEWPGALLGFWPAMIIYGCSEVLASRLWFPKKGRYEEYLRARSEWDRAQAEAEERARRAQAEFWRSLTGHAFEAELGALLKRVGYEVTRTPGSRDGGIDLILKHGGKTLVVQCKQTRSAVGPNVARDLFGAMVDFGADEGILATTGGVTSGVHEFFRGKSLRVMPLDEILELQRMYGRGSINSERGSKELSGTRQSAGSRASTS